MEVKVLHCVNTLIKQIPPVAKMAAGCLIHFPDMRPVLENTHWRGIIIPRRLISETEGGKMFVWIAEKSRGKKRPLDVDDGQTVSKLPAIKERRAESRAVSCVLILS